MEANPGTHLSATKRPRPSDSDEIVLDNYHLQKRYLTEVMASSLNGLKMADSGKRSGPAVGSASGGNALLVEFPGGFGMTETPSGSGPSASPFASHGDDMSTHDSTMSDDSEDSVGWRAANAYDLSHIPSQSPISRRSKSGSPPSPVSPGRGGKLPPIWSLSRPRSPTTSGPSASWVGTQTSPGGLNPWGTPFQRAANTSLGGQGPPPNTALQLQARPCSIPSHKSMTSPRHLTDKVDGKLPPSPNDPNQSANLRRAALLRSLQMRTQPQLPTSSANLANAEAGAVAGEEGVLGSGEGRDACSASTSGLQSSTTLGLHPSVLSMTSYMPDAHKGLSAASCTNSEAKGGGSLSRSVSRAAFPGVLSTSALGRPSDDGAMEVSAGLGTAEGAANDTWKPASDHPLPTIAALESSCSKGSQRPVMREEGFSLRSERTGSNLVGSCAESPMCSRGEVDSGRVAWGSLLETGQVEGDFGSTPECSPLDGSPEIHVRQPGKRAAGRWLTADRETRSSPKRHARRSSSGAGLALLRQNSSSLHDRTDFAFPTVEEANDDSGTVEALSPSSKGDNERCIGSVHEDI